MTANDKDYYTILGLPTTATEQEIKRAYRRLAREHHPDVNPGNTQAEEQFKELTEAYEVLSDRELRTKYDALVRDGQRASRSTGSERRPDRARCVPHPLPGGTARPLRH